MTRLIRRCPFRTSGLTPSLGTPVPTPDGYRVQILNYNGQYQWSGTATQNGQVTVDDNDGYATITGVAPNTNSVATITASRFAYTDRVPPPMGRRCWQNLIEPHQRDANGHWLHRGHPELRPAL